MVSVCLSFHTVEINLTSELWNKKRERLPGWVETHTDTYTCPNLSHTQSHKNNSSNSNATLQDEHKELSD